MSERENFGDMWLASFIGGSVGVMVVVGCILFSLAGELSVSVGELLLSAVFITAWGLVVAQISVVPLGALIGWLLALRNGANWLKAAIAGTLTGAVAGLAVTAGTLLGDPLPQAVAYALTTLLVVAVVGCVSGLVGYRIVFHRPQRADDAQ